MALAKLYTRANIGIDAPLVTVEVHLTNGLPALNIVGMAETAVKESKERVRSALLSSGYEFPARRITINLAPADLPKTGTQFDLAIALGILAASGQLPTEHLQQVEFLGELSLSGELRSVNGVLPAALACSTAERRLVCPSENIDEACLAPDIKLIPANSLLSLCQQIANPTEPLEHMVVSQPIPLAIPVDSSDMRDVRGQQQAKRALEIAAAGGHHALLYGPPGTGKSMLASRVTSLLPPLTPAEAIEVAALRSIHSHHSITGYPGRPYISPHHSASAVSLVGGGSYPKPGEISLAHNGVLFLDELPEFSRATLEGLRQPLESGVVRLSRANLQVEFPARFQLIAAMNPCPCGYLGAGASANDNPCRCTPDQIQRYRQRLSGPIVDRIDIQVPVPPLPSGDLFKAPDGEHSADIRERVAVSRNRQLQRQGKLNAQLSSAELEEICPLIRPHQQLLEQAVSRLGLSARALHKIIKVARSIADLTESEDLQKNHLLEAIGYRRLDRRNS